MLTYIVPYCPMESYLGRNCWPFFLAVIHRRMIDKNAQPLQTGMMYLDGLAKLPLLIRKRILQQYNFQQHFVLTASQVVAAPNYIFKGVSYNAQRPSEPLPYK